MAEEKETLKTAERLAALDPSSKEEPESAEEPQKESPSTEEPETAEKPVETPDETEEESVPEDKKEAGRAFAEKRHQLDEMQKRNEELEERLKALEENKSAEAPRFETPRPTFVGTPDLNQFIDPNTGEVDFVRYDQFKREETQRIIRQSLDEERQDLEAQATYPQLKKDSKDFDPKFYSAVIGYIATNLDKRITVKEAADEVVGLSEKVKKQLMSEGADKALEEVSAKEKAGLEAGGNAGRVAQAEGVAETEVLSERTRKGGSEGAEAIGERLKKMGI